MLASALNLQLGWGAKWKGVVADWTCILVLNLVLESKLHKLRVWHVRRHLEQVLAIDGRSLVVGRSG
jgi:hypothetical protein